MLTRIFFKTSLARWHAGCVGSIMLVADRDAEGAPVLMRKEQKSRLSAALSSSVFVTDVHVDEFLVILDAIIAIEKTIVEPIQERCVIDVVFHKRE